MTVLLPGLLLARTVVRTMALAVVPAVAEHLGRLHPYERLVVAAVAVGPFLVLGVVLSVIRRRDAAAEQPRAGRGDAETGHGPGTARNGRAPEGEAPGD